MTYACPSTLFYCACERSEGHDGPHSCACGGAWDEDEKVLNYPQKVVAEGPLFGVDVEEIVGPDADRRTP